MPTYTASEAKNSFGSLIDTALHEPVLVRKHGRDSVVMLSKRDYVHYLQQADDAYWGQRAAEESVAETVGAEASQQLLESLLNA